MEAADNANINCPSKVIIIIKVMYNLLLQLDNADSQESIDDIIDDPRFMAILNSSGWPVTRCVSLTSKAELLQQLIFSEVVLKRQQAIHHLCTGLGHLNIMKLMRENEDLMKPVFLFDTDQQLTPDVLCNSIATPKPSDENLKRVYEWFLEYIRAAEERKASLEDILSFTTGLKRIPPMGLKECIKIEFLHRSPLPEAETCFSIIKLPTVHTSKAVFFSKLDLGIQNSIGHFGLI